MLSLLHAVSNISITCKKNGNKKPSCRWDSWALQPEVDLGANWQHTTGDRQYWTVNVTRATLELSSAVVCLRLGMRTDASPADSNYVITHTRAWGSEPESDRLQIVGVLSKKLHNSLNIWTLEPVLRRQIHRLTAVENSHLIERLTKYYYYSRFLGLFLNSIIFGISTASFSHPKVIQMTQTTASKAALVSK